MQSAVEVIITLSALVLALGLAFVLSQYVETRR
jgi:hypothetical protein